MKKLFSLFLVVCFIALLFFGYQFWSITAIGENTRPVKADVIIVLGAAVWSGGPSPALQARIEHGADIYHQGLAERLILSGGLGQHPPTEALAMQKELIRLGLSPEILFLEDKATNTQENIIFSKEIMDQHGWNTAIIVTDTFHLKRALIIAEEKGLTVFGAPVKNSVLYTNKALRIQYTLREVLALTEYYVKKLLA